ncbi:NADH-FMN oxidoreductase RutF, flavin reductase (DIM6/NTAB) family [Cyclonatronum proteinivorum]|uniref:NADH-FMN oxidoreductase RutF, flavin reductase (DIM6/NTAB) family n=1 Tax=Cyclonatronum proteinivorum TaxID=1457365 RepID=A0A345UKQ5_9BACT|nr:flavin reductase family protein [Cyclonatronum proteinivorum]AXJ01057.1 NADH-FMN oxidoreductase RutF, flavin reductase (DIM6/NTAB) family [Cyclonatronum proteinivorum]
MEINPQEISQQERYKLLIGSVIPRPIAFVSTVSSRGVRNLSPFSYFTVAAVNPMIVVFFPLRFKTGTERKDTVKNIMETRQFVVNIASESITEQLNRTSGIYEEDADEFEISGLTAVASKAVVPPGVAECKIRMECELYEMMAIGEKGSGGSDAIFGKVLHYYADDDLIAGYKIDEQQLNPISRLGGLKYGMIGNIKELPRP